MSEVPLYYAQSESTREERSVDASLIGCINQMDLYSQLPQNIVNLLFTITNSNSELTVLWRTYFLKPFDQYILSKTI
jgi:hypothetical protein